MPDPLSMKPTLKRGQYVQAQSALYNAAGDVVAKSGAVGLVTDLKGHSFDGFTVGMLALVYFEDGGASGRSCWVNERALKPA